MTAQEDNYSPSEIRQEKDEQNGPNVKCPYERFPCCGMQSSLLWNAPTVRCQENVNNCSQSIHGKHNDA